MDSVISPTGSEQGESVTKESQIGLSGWVLLGQESNLKVHNVGFWVGGSVLPGRSYVERKNR